MNTELVTLFYIKGDRVQKLEELFTRLGWFHERDTEDTLLVTYPCSDERLFDFVISLL